MTDEAAVLAAAERCVAAFGAHRRDDYLACFAPDATFVFHTTPRVLASRAEWEAEWDVLEREHGFLVLSCESSERRVQLLGDVAVFTHRVHTVLRADGVEEAVDERETIVFRHGTDGNWLAVHEHLSPLPG